MPRLLRARQIANRLAVRKAHLNYRCIPMNAHIQYQNTSQFIFQLMNLYMIIILILGYHNTNNLKKYELL